MRGTEGDASPSALSGRTYHPGGAFGERDEDEVKSSGPSGEGIEPSQQLLTDGEGAASPSVAGDHMMSYTTAACGEGDASPSALSGKTCHPGGALGEGEEEINYTSHQSEERKNYEHSHSH